MYKVFYLIGFTYILSVGVQSADSFFISSMLLILVSGLYMFLFSVWGIYHDDN